MSLFSISDLHLSISVSKPMDVFGNRWRGYMEKLRKNWLAVVKDGDTVVIPGDISWAMTLEEAEADFRFIESLPGKKLIGKGNHDYWWSTVTKMKRYLSERGMTTIDFLYNNAFATEEFIICGTRGWFSEERLQPGDADFVKISARECGRLRTSLDAAKRLADCDDNHGKPILVYLHFPPVFGEFRDGELIKLMKEYGVTNCYYGHIHGKYDAPRTFAEGSLQTSIISADYLNFVPMITRPATTTRRQSRFL